MKPYPFIFCLAFLLFASFHTSAQTITPPRQEYVLKFENSIVKAPVDAKLKLGSTFTMMAWIFPTDLNPYGVIMGKPAPNRDADPYMSYTIGWNGDGTKLEFVQTTGVAGTYRSVYSANTIELNRWTHVAAILDGSSMCLYINGIKVSCGVSPGAPPVNDVPFTVGGGINGTNHCCNFTGYIMQAGIWAKALTAGETQNSASNIPGSSSANLVAFWKMDEGSGQVSNDLSSNHLNLTLGLSNLDENADPKWFNFDTLSLLPTINSFTPESGKNGDTITLCGTNFTGTTHVSFGNISSNFTIKSDTVLMAIVPKAARSGKISVTNNKVGSVSSIRNFIITSVFEYFHIDTTEYHSPYKDLQPGDAVLLDIDSDGNPDAILIENNCSTWEPMPVYAFINDGKGKLTDKTESVFNKGKVYTIGINMMIPADFNGDKKDDVYLPDGGPDRPPWGGSTNTLLIQTPGGHLENQSKDRLPYSKQYTHYATSADIDNDGDLDIFDLNVCCADNQETVLMINDGNGFFTKQNHRLPADVVNEVGKFQAALFVDVDRDGDKDLILGSHGTYAGKNLERDVILLNDGNAFFTYAPATSMPIRKGAPNWGVTEIISGDFNGDGWEDLIMETLSSDIPTTTWIVLLLNNKNGTFSFPENAVIKYTDTFRLTTADINADGWLDLFIAGDLGDCSSFMMNSGNAVFVDKTDELGFAGNHFVPIMPGDLNGDGKIDFFALSAQNIWYYSAINLNPFDMGIPHLNKPGKPAGTYPKNNVHTTLTPIFKWQPDGVNGSYQIQVASDIAFSDILYDRKDITALDAILVSQKELGSYYWRIRGKNTAGIGPWSDIMQYTAGNRNPEKLELSSNIMRSDSKKGFLIGLFKTYDPDNGEQHTYTLIKGNGENDADNDRFLIKGDSLISNVWSISDGKIELHIYVQTDDGNGGILKQSFVISVLPACLVAWYPFNGNANDESNKGRSGIVNGPVLTTDRYGNANQAYYFDGVNDYIQLGSGTGLITSPTHLTISAWIYPDELLADTLQTIISERNAGNNFQLAVNNKRCFFSYWTSGNEYSFIGKELQEKTWYNLAVSYDGSKQKLYIDGTLDQVADASGPIDSNPSALLLGLLNRTQGGFKGKIDDVAIYDCVLSDDEIGDVYKYKATLGITELKEQAISLYPNPSKGQFSFRIPDTNTGSFQAKCYDISGRMVIDKILQPGQDGTLTVDLNGQPKGIYVLQLKNATFTRTVKLILE
jgi:hypothetical protein